MRFDNVVASRQLKPMIRAAAILIALLLILAGCAPGDSQSSLTDSRKPTEKAPFSFIYMGDPQADPETGDYGKWGELLHMAAEDESQPSFILLGGDLVNQGDDREEWESFFEAGGNVLKSLPVYPAMGNHDNTGFFSEFFNLPQNGPEGKKGSFYSFDYEDAHFVVLDSNAMGAANPEDVDWLRKDLASTDKEYRIVMFHHPAYTASYNPKDEMRAEKIRQVFVPVFEEYDVNLVLSGHQHVYMRTHPLKEGSIGDDGIVYLTGISGGKYYAPAQRDYAAFALGKESVYTVCTVDGEGIEIKTYNSSGDLVDNFLAGKKGSAVSLKEDQEAQTLTITDEGSGREWSYTLKELGEIDRIGYEHVFSTVNNWPTPSFYGVKGLKIRRILQETGVYQGAKILTFRSSDGYEMSFTKDQLFGSPRKFYPHLVEGKEDGASAVEAVLAYAYKEGSDNIGEAVPKALCLIFGQKNLSEHTNPAFVEDVTHIIVSDREPPAWEAASTFPLEGNIAPGETVKLQHPSFGLVKLHYTLDGSEPTELSPMYNPSTYQPELNVPITIREDVVIRVIAVGYGKNNSPIAEFHFKTTGGGS